MTQQVATAPAEPPAPEFPRVPADSFVTFRAEARQRLDTDAFAVVDARYRAAFDLARAWFGTEAQVGEEAVLGLIRSQLHGCSCTDEMLTAQRAIEAAAFRAGWLVSVELDRLVVTADRTSAAAIHSPQTWRRLRAYREPYRGAACALAAAELAPETMTSLALGQVDPEGTSVTPSDRPAPVEIPQGADVYLRAQLWYRRLQGAGDSDLLFAGDPGPMRARYLADAVRCPLGEVGVPLFSQMVDRAEIDSKRWANRWGLSVQEL